MDYVNLVKTLCASKEEKEWYDFKENWFDPVGIGEYISALSNGATLVNQKKGYLIWGVSDKDHNIIGTNLNYNINIKGEPFDHFLVRQLDPSINFVFIEEVIDDKRVVILEIDAAKRIPTEFNKERFIRIGSSKENIKRYREREILLWDALKQEKETMVNKPAPFYCQDLTFNKLLLYYASKGIELNKDTFVKNLHLRTEEGNYNILALVLADNNQIPIRVSVFAGTSKADPLYSVKEYGNTCILYALDQILLYGDSLNIMQADEKNRVIERKEIPFFDAKAFKEAVMNAFVHNTWTTMSAPMINVYTDRIEILSRGTIPETQTFDGFYRGESIPVNDELATIFLQLRLSERSGMGVPKVIRAYGKEAFNFNDNSIVVTIPFNKINVINSEVDQKVDQKVDQRLGKSKVKIINLILNNYGISLNEIRIATGLSLQAVKKNIRELKELGIIERIGNNQTGYWKVIKKND